MPRVEGSPIVIMGDLKAQVMNSVISLYTSFL